MMTCGFQAGMQRARAAVPAGQPKREWHSVLTWQGTHDARKYVGTRLGPPPHGPPKLVGALLFSLVCSLACLLLAPPPGVLRLRRASCGLRIGTSMPIGCGGDGPRPRPCGSRSGRRWCRSGCCSLVVMRLPVSLAGKGSGPLPLGPPIFILVVQGQVYYRRCSWSGLMLLLLLLLLVSVEARQQQLRHTGILCQVQHNLRTLLRHCSGSNAHKIQPSPRC
jgi:hypothetical protein